MESPEEEKPFEVIVSGFNRPFLYALYMFFTISLLSEFIIIYVILRTKFMNKKKNAIFINFIIWDIFKTIAMLLLVVFISRFVSSNSYIILFNFTVFFFVCSVFTLTVFMMIGISQTIMNSNKLRWGYIVTLVYVILLSIVTIKFILIISNVESHELFDASILFVVVVLILVFIINDIRTCCCSSTEMSLERKLFQNCGRFTIYVNILCNIFAKIHSSYYSEVFKYLSLFMIVTPLFNLIYIIKLDEKLKICCTDLIRCNFRNNPADITETEIEKNINESINVGPNHNNENHCRTSINLD